MQRVLHILSLAPERKDEFILRLERARYEPETYNVPNSTPSSHVRISLTVTIHGYTKRQILKEILNEFQVTIIEGPQNLDPTRWEKFRERVGDSGKETLIIFAECIVAVHGAVLLILYKNSMPFTALQQSDYFELIGIASIPSLIYFLTSGAKYNKSIT